MQNEVCLRDGWTDAQINGQKDGWTAGRTDRLTYKKRERWTDITTNNNLEKKKLIEENQPIQQNYAFYVISKSLFCNI